MAEIKDYYKILDVKSSANADVIKKAYRRLAMKYHPDHNPGDALAAAVFEDVAEAYKTLSDTEARKQYNFNRYLVANEEYKRPAATIDAIIFRMHRITEQVKLADPFRFNKDALLYSIKQLLPEDISLLLHTNEKLLKQFLEMVCAAVAHLSSHQTKKIMVLMQPLYKKEKWLYETLDLIMQNQQKKERWEKYKIVLVVLLTIILCVIIFFAASK